MVRALSLLQSLRDLDRGKAGIGVGGHLAHMHVAFDGRAVSEDGSRRNVTQGGFQWPVPNGPTRKFSQIPLTLVMSIIQRIQLDLEWKKVLHRCSKSVSTIQPVLKIEVRI